MLPCGGGLLNGNRAAVPAALNGNEAETLVSADAPPTNGNAAALFGGAMPNGKLATVLLCCDERGEPKPLGALLSVPNGKLGTGLPCTIMELPKGNDGSVFPCCGPWV